VKAVHACPGHDTIKAFGFKVDPTVDFAIQRVDIGMPGQGSSPPFEPVSERYFVHRYKQDRLKMEQQRR
jgi:hypothetical protein